MILLNSTSNTTLSRVTVALEPSEALELIEKLSYLIRDPSYHHDHLESGSVALDLVVLHPENAGTYAEALQEAIRRKADQREV